MSSLIDKSLLAADRSEHATRYRQLETVRQYAEERLVASGEADAVRERHARHFAAFAREAGRGLWSGDEIAWAQRVEADLDNVRAAVSWAVAARETDLAMRIAAALVTQAVERPAWATASIAEQALTAPGADSHPLRAIAMGEAAWAAARIGDMDRARALIEESIEAQRRGARFTASVWTYAPTLFDLDSDRTEIAIARAEEALARAEQAGDVVGAIALRAAHAVTLIGWATDRWADARDSAERALSEARALGQPALIAMGLLALGEVLVIGGEAERGLAMVRESRELSREINSNWQSISAAGALAYLEAFHGEPVRAAAELHELLASFQRGNDPPAFGIGAIFGAMAVFCRIGRADLVARADGALRSSRQQDGLFFGPYGGYIAWLDQAVNEAHAALGDRRYESLAREGATLSLEALVDEMVAILNEFLAEA